MRRIGGTWRRLAAGVDPILGSTARRIRTLARSRRTRELEDRLSRLELQNEAFNQHAMVILTDGDSRIVSINERFLMVTGWRREDLIDRPVGTLYVPEERALLNEVSDKIFHERSVWQAETRLRCRDGSVIWTRATVSPRINSRGDVIGAVSVRTDITAVKAAAAEREMVSSLRQLADEVYILDPETLGFRYLNEAARSRMRWSLEECQSRTVYDALPSFDGEQFARTVEPLVSGESEQVVRTLTLKGRPFEARVQLVEPTPGDPRFIIILRDVSERFEIERIKDEFISTVSHELRSPLTSIKGSMGLILAGAAGEISDKSRRMLEIAHRNADRLVLIVNDILDLEKIAAGRMQFHFDTSDLREVAQEAIQGNQAFADGFGVKIRTEGFDRPVVAQFDADRIFQVLTNLLSNAAKFSHPGGEILLRLEGGDESARLTVRDRGTGIPAEAQARIFDRFSQADTSDQREKGGTGLGLAIVKAILERHDAAIEFHSVEGEGTTFCFELPLASTSVQPLSAVG